MSLAMIAILLPTAKSQECEKYIKLPPPYLNGYTMNDDGKMVLNEYAQVQWLLNQRQIIANNITIGR